MIRLVSKETSAKMKILNYIKHLNPNEKLRVVFGGHWSNNPGWLILDENEQNITETLNFKDNTVDVIFTEHVIEHISLPDSIFFMKESKRILKTGGVLRIVAPMLEKLIAADFSDPNGKIYIKNSLYPYFSDEHEQLKQLNFDGVFEAPIVFLFNSMYRLHGHQFIWSANLMIKVLKALGFKSVKKRKVGEGFNQEYCIERRARGIYLGYDWKEDRALNFIYDPESMVIEAIK